MRVLTENRSAGAAVVLLCIGISCGTNESGLNQESTSSSGNSVQCSPDISWIQQNILAANCVSSGCHSANEPAVGLDLESEGLADRLIDGQASSCDAVLVKPGNPALSFFYEKLVASAPACGDPMPPTAPLDDASVACVGEWIRGLSGGCETCGGTACVELASDASNCGACGVQCPADATCDGGMCTCENGGTLCGGTCVDTASDPAHCGACDNSCGADLVCSSGQCKSGCDGSLTQCGASCVNIKTDAAHCGACDAACAGNEVCSDGVCGCGPGIDTQTDPNNCGSCGNVCAPGLSCSGGVCSCGSASVSFGSEILPILTSGCATIGCHQGMKPKANLDLTAGKAYAQLVNQPTSQCGGNRLRVKPGEPGASYLIDKILGTNMCFGSKMPKMGSVPAADVELISNWICGGAADN